MLIAHVDALWCQYLVKGVRHDNNTLKCCTKLGLKSGKKFAIWWFTKAAMLRDRKGRGTAALPTMVAAQYASKTNKSLPLHLHARDTHSFEKLHSLLTVDREVKAHFLTL